MVRNENYNFKKLIAKNFDLKIHEEIRAARMMSRPGNLIRAAARSTAAMNTFSEIEVSLFPEYSGMCNYQDPGRGKGVVPCKSGIEF